MSGLEILLRVLAGVLLLLSNAFFVVTEFALTRLRQHPKKEIEDDPGLQRAWRMTERLEIHLTGCQLGISLTSILLGVLTEPAVTELLEPLYEWLGVGGGTRYTVSVVTAIVLINFAHKIWGEQAPTYLGVERPLTVSRYCAPVLDWWTYLTFPLIYLGDGAAKKTLRLFGVEITRSWAEEEAGDEKKQLGRAELREEMVKLLGRGEVVEERREEILSALDVGSMTVSEIMIPRAEIVHLSTTRSIDENLATIANHDHIRYPLTGDSLDDYVGVIYLPAVFRHHQALLGGQTELESLATSPLRVDEGLSVAGLIDTLQEEQQEAALVVDGEEQVVGFVTATDAFEAVVGELEDPFD